MNDDGVVDEQDISDVLAGLQNPAGGSQATSVAASVVVTAGFSSVETSGEDSFMALALHDWLTRAEDDAEDAPLLVAPASLP